MPPQTLNVGLCVTRGYGGKRLRQCGMGNVVLVVHRLQKNLLQLLLESRAAGF